MSEIVGMAKNKDVKELPAQFTLSDIERIEFERQIAVKRWLDARLEIAQRDYNEATRALTQSYDAWAHKLTRRLGISPQDLTRYNFSADGTAKTKQEDAQALESAPPPQQG